MNFMANKPPAPPRTPRVTVPGRTSLPRMRTVGILLAAGVKAIVQPGGSVRDAETIAAAEAAGVSLYFTGTRHFFH